MAPDTPISSRMLERCFASRRILPAAARPAQRWAPAPARTPARTAPHAPAEPRPPTDPWTRGRSDPRRPRPANPKPIRDKQNIEEGTPRARKSRGKIRRGVVECGDLWDNPANSPLDRFASDRRGFRIHEALREAAKGRRTGAHTISTIPWREAPEEERWKAAVDGVVVGQFWAGAGHGGAGSLRAWARSASIRVRARSASIRARARSAGKARTGRDGDPRARRGQGAMVSGSLRAWARSACLHSAGDAGV
jgi:hypothetical protein